MGGQSKVRVRRGRRGFLLRIVVVYILLVPSLIKRQNNESMRNACIYKFMKMHECRSHGPLQHETKSVGKFPSPVF